LRPENPEARPNAPRPRGSSRTLCAPDSVLLIDAQTGEIAEFNRQAHETLGYTREEFRRLKVEDFEAIESAEEISAHMHAVRETGQDVFETRHRTKDGRLLDILATARAITLMDRAYFIAIWTDITERKRAAEALDRHRAELQAIYDHAPVMMCVLDSERRIQYANRAFSGFCGVPEEELLQGRACGVFGCINALDDARGCGFGPNCPVCELRMAIADTFASGTSHRGIEYEATLEQNGRRREVILSGATALVRATDQDSLLLCLQDVTEQRLAARRAKERQEELLHVSRLSTLGEMASGLAHELNQPLSAILSFANASVRSVEREGPDLARIRKNLDQIVSQSVRAGEIMRRIPAFAQRRRPTVGAVSINERVQDALDLVQHDLRHGQIQVVQELDRNLPSVLADAVQMEQVLMNLVRNAIEAMQSVPPESRRLTVRTQTASEDQLTVSIADTGPGLAADVAPRVFDPFFTTKPEGLGVGLSITRSIIEAHRGQIWVEPDAVRGCIFTFRIPTKALEPEEEQGDPNHE
jgi:PAS domain S-box-containing protein